MSVNRLFVIGIGPISDLERVYAPDRRKQR